MLLMEVRACEYNEIYFIVSCSHSVPRRSKYTMEALQTVGQNGEMERDVQLDSRYFLNVFFCCNKRRYANESHDWRTLTRNVIRSCDKT